MPGTGPTLESEQLLQVFFVESGTRADTLATLRAARAWADERNEDDLAAIEAYRAGTGPFPERTAQTMLVGGFLTEYYRLVASWAEWAAEVVEGWPEDPRAVQAPAAELERIDQRARWPERFGREWSAGARHRRSDGGRAGALRRPRQLWTALIPAQASR